MGGILVAARSHRTRGADLILRGCLELALACSTFRLPPWLGADAIRFHPRLSGFLVGELLENDWEREKFALGMVRTLEKRQPFS